MNKNDKIEVLKFLTEQIRKNLIDDATYRDLIQDLKDLGITQEEIDKAIANNGKITKAVNQSANDVKKLSNSSQKIVEQSTETINAVSKLQTEVSKNLTNINKNINIANKKVKQQSAKFSGLGGAGVKLMPGVEHEYVHTATKGDAKSQAAKAKLDKQIDKQHRLSVTKIAGILTQSDVDVLQKQLDAMQGQEFTKEYADLKNKLNKAKEVHTGSVVSAKRGTAFHKIAELLEKGEFSIEQLTDQKIAELGEKYDEIKQGILAGGSQKDSISRLRKMTQDYEKFKTQNKLSGSVTTEKSVGFLTKIGEEWVEVVGTLDSFFNEINTLTDFKTGQAVDPKKIGIQLNLLKKALELQGIDTKDMKVFHLPFKSYREGGVYNVKGVDENTLYQWVSDAFNMFWGKQLKPTEDIKTLMESRLEPYEFTISKGEEKGQKRKSWKLNKRTLSSLEKDYAKGYLSADDVISMVQGLNPEDYEHFMNLLWSTKEYGAGKPASGVESNKLYRQGALWKELRARIPSFYTGLRASSGISEKTFIDEEGNLAAATTIGGGFLSQWSKAYRLKLAQSGEQAAQEIIDQFVKIVKESTDEIGQEETFGRLSALSLKDSINDIFVDAVGKTLFGDFYEGFDVNDIGINDRSKEENAAIAIRNKKKAGERFYNEQGKLIRRLRGFEEFDVSGLESEKVISFVKGIGSLKNIFKGALNEIGGTEMSQLNEAGLPEFIENSEYLLDRWDQFILVIKNKIEPIVKNMKVTARQTGNWKSVNSIENALNNLYLTEDIPMLTTKTAHRFSWLYQAKDLYDKMLETELPKGMTTEEYARQRLIPKQYEQYIGSLELRHIAERSGGSLDELINNFLKAPVELLSSDLSKNIQDSLFKIKESSPELLKTTFYDIISKQTTLTGGESQKLNWWESVGAIERLRRGEEIKAWDPKSFEKVNTSNVLISYLDEQIRDAIDSVSKGGAQASAEASKNLRKYLEELGVKGGPLNRLMRGDTAGLLEKYGITQDTESGKKYAELLERAKGVYSDKTAWTRESIIETFKDMPEKLSTVLQLVDILERVKGLPPAIFGEKKDEQKVAETKVDSDRTEVVADTIVIGELEKIAEKAKTAKRRGRPKKKKAEGVAVTTPIEDVYPEISSNKTRVSLDDGAAPAGGSGGKGGGKKGKTDEEKTEADRLKVLKQDAKDYQQYMNKLVSYESQVDKYQRQSALSSGKQKDAIDNTVDSLNLEIAALKNSHKELVDRMADQQKDTKDRIDATAELRKQTNAQKNLVSVKGATSIWDMMANDIRRATMRIADFGIAAKVLNKIPQDIQKVIQYTKELDAAMTNIRIVGGYTEEQAKSLMKSYTELGKTLGATTTEIAQGMNDWLRQGYEAEDQLESLISASVKLSKLGMISTSEATAALTAALKGFNLEANKAIDIVDKLTKVDQKAAVSAGGISEAISKASVSAKQAGMSIDELIGSVSVIGETTQQSMDSVGNAMKTLLARYGNVKAGVFTSMGLDDDGETSENINDIEKVLRKLGIRIRSSSTEMRDITDVLDEIAAKWNTLDDVSRSAVSTAFAGVRQREQFNVLMENWTRAKELTEESANAAGTADEKYTAYMDSMEAATKRLQNAWEGFAQSLEVSPVMKFLTNTAAFFVENADKLKYVLTALAAVNSAKIFDFVTSKGETGGIKGLLSNIPILGDRMKTNNILESIDKKVGAIQGEVEKDNVTKNGGLISRIKAGFSQRATDKKLIQNNGALRDADISFIQNYESGKFDKMNLTSDEQFEYYKHYLKLKQTEGDVSDAAARLAADKAMRGRAFGKTAATAGISTLLTQLGANKTVGTQSGGLSGELSKLIVGSNNTQSVEETAGDKAARTAGSTIGAVAGAATAFIPVVGPLIAPIASSLGSVAGEGIGGLLSTWFHKDELEMKQRVADAKENLSVLKSVEENTRNSVDVLEKNSYTSDDYKKLQSYVDSLRESFSDNAKLKEEFLKDIKSSGIGNYSTIEELYSQITKGDAEINKALKGQLELTTARLKIENTLNSQEISRNSVSKTVNENLAKNAAIKGGTWQTQTTQYGYNNSRNIMTTTQITSKLLGLYEQLNKEGLISYEAEETSFAGTTSSHQMQRNVLTDIYVKGDDIYEKLDNAEKILADVRLNAEKVQNITSNEVKELISGWESVVVEYREQADKLTRLNKELLSTQVDYAYLTSDILNTFTPDEIYEKGFEGVVDIIRDQLIEQGVAVVDDFGKIHKDVYDIISVKIKSETMLYDYITRSQKSIGVLIKNNDVQAIEAFARAFGITADKAKKLGEQFDYLTQSMGIMNVEETTEYYEKLGNVFSELASNANLTASEINNLLSTSELKDLLPYLMSGGGTDAVLKELYKRLYGGGQDIHMENALYDATMEMNTDYFVDYLKKRGRDDFVNFISKKGYKTLLSIREDFDDLNDEQKQEFLDYLDSISYTYKKDLSILEKPAEYLKSQLENQINNLQEQKDALSDINNEREREIELIKAKDALENAKKEKRRVYRAGVGFTYETNEEAIAEAQKNLENLNVQKRQDDLQTQIDMLQLQKDIVGALPNHEELEQTKKIYELWAADASVNGSLASVAEKVTVLSDAYQNATAVLDLRAKTEDWLKKPGEESERETSEEHTDPTTIMNSEQIKETQELISSNVVDILSILKENYGAPSQKNAAGSKSFTGGRTLINELGTEAIITPSGTVTALPAKTGIVPADITKNLWSLGEVAPTLVARLGSLNQKAVSGVAGNTTYEEGQYFDNFTMNVYPASGDDFSKILEQARARVKLTRHNN